MQAHQVRDDDEGYDAQTQGNEHGGHMYETKYFIYVCGWQNSFGYFIQQERIKLYL